MRTLGGFGEFNFIDRLSGLVPRPASVVEGIGDDCAVLKYGENLLLVTSDAAIEDIHFRRGAVPPHDLGWKIAAAALSDMAAMGGRPRHALLTLAAPPDFPVDELESLCRGIFALMEEFQTVIVGGDTTRSNQGLIVDLTIIGEVAGGRYLTRQGAQPGDKLLVTGTLGGAGAGLHAQENGIDAPELIQGHYRVRPRIAEGQWLAERAEVHALIDISDGLARDAGHLIEAGQLGADIDSASLPVSGQVEVYCREQGLDTVEMAVSKGEDYELLCAVDGKAAKTLVKAFSGEFDLSLSIVGEFMDAPPNLTIDGSPSPYSGFDHFDKDTKS